MGFKQQLQEKLGDKLSEKELSLLPGGFQTLGKIIVLKLKPELRDKKELIAKSTLELYPHMRSIYLNKGTIEGKFRTPENIEHVTGEKNPLVEHKEHGVTYIFDITKIMFSQGNLAERKRLPKLVQDGEIIVDMFAGIGYFTLPIAVNSHPEKIYSIELNPTSYEYLKKNIKENKVEELVIPIHGNSKEEVLNLSDSGVRADRVIMGVFPAPKEYISEALTLTSEKGTTFHYEGVVDEEEYMDLFDEFNVIGKNLGYKSELKNKTFVKSYGPHLYHTVLDIRVEKL